MPTTNDVRVPTSAWPGYGLSLTSPSSIFTEQKEFLNSHNDLFDSDPWKSSGDMSPFSNLNDRDHNTSYMSNSNAIESVPSGMLKRIQNCDTDLPALLASLGLEKYIQLFKSQEIDMSSFLMFNDANLKEIGVTAYGARHKMMLVIAELKKRQSSLISAAPGAERKRSHGWPKSEQ